MRWSFTVEVVEMCVASSFILAEEVEKSVVRGGKEAWKGWWEMVM